MTEQFEHWTDIPLSDDTIKRMKKLGYLEKHTQYRLNAKGHAFLNETLGIDARERRLYQVSYTTESGQQASAVVAASSVERVIDEYPNWDSIQKDSTVIVLD